MGQTTAMYMSAHQAHEAYKRMVAEDKKANAIYQAYMTKKLVEEMKSPAKSVVTGAKCTSCGYHQFVMHANRRICSYCRSEG